MADDLTLHKVTLNLCRACIDGVGSECHTWGCDLFLHSVDIPILSARDQVGAAAAPDGGTVAEGSRTLITAEIRAQLAAAEAAGIDLGREYLTGMVSALDQVDAALAGRVVVELLPPGDTDSDGDPLWSVDGMHTVVAYLDRRYPVVRMPDGEDAPPEWVERYAVVLLAAVAESRRLAAEAAATAQTLDELEARGLIERVPDRRTCEAPGDQEHDHATCQDVVAEEQAETAPALDGRIAIDGARVQVTLAGANWRDAMDPGDHCG